MYMFFKKHDGVTSSKFVPAAPDYVMYMLLKLIEILRTHKLMLLCNRQCEMNEPDCI